MVTECFGNPVGHISIPYLANFLNIRHFEPSSHNTGCRTLGLLILSYKNVERSFRSTFVENQAEATEALTRYITEKGGIPSARDALSTPDQISIRYCLNQYLLVAKTA